MAFIARVKELGRVLTGTNNDSELNINQDSLNDDEIEKIIMVDSMAMELLKALSSLKKSEEPVEKGVYDSNKTKKGLNKYKTNTVNQPKRSLDDMTKILEQPTNSKEERVD